MEGFRAELLAREVIVISLSSSINASCRRSNEERLICMKSKESVFERFLFMLGLLLTRLRPEVAVVLVLELWRSRKLFLCFWSS